jgi:class 3 adenylate cyclase
MADIIHSAGVSNPPNRGSLFVADITGYTEFLAKTEIEHATIVVNALLQTIAECIGEKLTIVKLEGDAVFAYAEESRQPEGPWMLVLLDEMYSAFRTATEVMQEQITCDCMACQKVHTLDIKFMVHHGEFVIQNVFGNTNLLGNDVNLLHRLLKNHVTPQTGWKAYALLTKQAYDRFKSSQTAAVQMTEEYEHIGEVETYAIKMKRQMT